jgi:integrase
VTGIRIGELLPLKVGQLETLLKEGWISIDRLKKGPANHKAFLTSEGKKIVKARKRDFKFLFVMKDKDSYVFTSDRKPYQMLRRETITMDVNRVMYSVSSLLPSKPNITSHSFRIGYISQLWKDTKDIEFVRQTMGHSSLNSTSSYVNQMGDEERQNRISSIKV